MAAYRWIMYTSQNTPGNVSFDLTRHASLKDAKSFFEDFCEAVGTNECRASLHVHDEQSWNEALEFIDTGCPFDYPDRVIECGPQGGIKVSNT